MGTDHAGETAAPRSTTPADAAYRYAAFISYRHAPADRRWAIWLHRALEAYSVPSRLRRSAGLPPRVGRCFRDEEELPASADLSAEIDKALEQSRFLIVVCSPRTPDSEWVNQEVRRFRQMGRHDRILALLIEGEPVDSFPPSLREIRRTVTDAGGLTREQVEKVEPLAADVRSSREQSRGHLGRMARLRLLACLLGVPFDDLRQREQERRVRQLVALTGGMAALLAVFAAVSAVAVYEWRKADGLTKQAQALTNRALVGETVAAQQKAVAEANARDAHRRLSDIYTRDGWAKVEAGDPAAALLWLARAVEVLADDAPAAKPARSRFATTLAIAPRLIDTDFHAAFEAVDSRVSRGRRLEWDDYNSKKYNGVKIVGIETGQLVASLPLVHGVVSAAFSPDGQRVLTVSDDGTAQVWEAATGHPVTEPFSGNYKVTFATFSPDGQRVATAGKDGLDTGGEALVWNAATGKAVTPPLYHFGPDSDSLHTHPVNSVVFSPNGRQVATLSGNEVRVWNAANGDSVTPPLPHKHPVTSAVFSPDGRRMVTATWEAEVGFQDRLWDVAAGKSVTPPLSRRRGVSRAAFSPDGQRVVMGDEVREAATGESVSHPWRQEEFVNKEDSESAVFSPDGKFLAAKSRNEVRIWDLFAEAPVTPPLRHGTDYLTAVAFSPDGRLISTTGHDSMARVWDAASGRTIGVPIKLEESDVTSAAFSPDGRWIAVSGSGGTRVWDSDSGQPVSPSFGPMVVNGSSIVGSTVFSPDNRHVATLTRGAFADRDPSEAQIWDALTGKAVTGPLKHTMRIHSIAFSPDARWLVTASADHTAEVWNAESGDPVTPSLQHKSVVYAAAFSPDGRRLATAGGDIITDTGEARLWDVAHGKLITGPLDNAKAVLSIAFSADGRQVATASTDCAVRTWDADTGKLITSVLGHYDVESASFSSDSHLLFTSSRNTDSVRVWDSATGKAITPQITCHGGIRCNAFSADGRRVAIACGDARARVWDAATGQPLTPTLEGELITFVTLSPDGQRVFMASVNGLARVWDIGPDNRSAADLTELAELLSGQRLDSTGALVVLAAGEWQARWDDLRKRYRADFRPRPNWVYEAMGLPATQPATAPATEPPTRPAAGGGREKGKGKRVGS